MFFFLNGVFTYPEITNHEISHWIIDYRIEVAKEKNNTKLEVELLVFGENLQFFRFFFQVLKVNLLLSVLFERQLLLFSFKQLPFNKIQQPESSLDSHYVLKDGSSFVTNLWVSLIDICIRSTCWY